MLAIDVELHLGDAFNHVLALLDFGTVQILALHFHCHSEDLLEDL